MSSEFANYVPIQDISEEESGIITLTETVGESVSFPDPTELTETITESVTVNIT